MKATDALQDGPQTVVASGAAGPSTEAEAPVQVDTHADSVMLESIKGMSWFTTSLKLTGDQDQQG